MAASPVSTASGRCPQVFHRLVHRMADLRARRRVIHNVQLRRCERRLFLVVGEDCPAQRVSYPQAEVIHRSRGVWKSHTPVDNELSTGDPPRGRAERRAGSARAGSEARGCEQVGREPAARVRAGQGGSPVAGAAAHPPTPATARTRAGQGVGRAPGRTWERFRGGVRPRRPQARFDPGRTRSYLLYAYADDLPAPVSARRRGRGSCTRRPRISWGSVVVLILTRPWSQ